MHITNRIGVSKLLLEKYKSLGLEPTLEDYWVLDTRNNNLTGPYNLRAAKEMVFRLHGYLEKHGSEERPFVVLYIDGTIQD